MRLSQTSRTEGSGQLESQHSYQPSWSVSLRPLKRCLAPGRAPLLLGEGEVEAARRFHCETEIDTHGGAPTVVAPSEERNL